MSEKMEALLQALYMDKVPPSWVKASWPSQRALGVSVFIFVGGCVCFGGVVCVWGRICLSGR
jgi:hypothetical protein